MLPRHNLVPPEGIEPTRVIRQRIYSPFRLLNGLRRRMMISYFDGYRRKDQYGSREGTRTLKTCILSAVPMPIRLLGHYGACYGIRTRPVRFLRPLTLPAGLSKHLVSLRGFEPPTLRFWAVCVCRSATRIWYATSSIAAVRTYMLRVNDSA